MIITDAENRPKPQPIESNLGVLGAAATSALAEFVLEKLKSAGPAARAKAANTLRTIMALAIDEGNSWATLSPTPGRDIILKGGSNAIEMQVLLNGQTIRAVLSDSSFDMRRHQQANYASELGGRLATRLESRAVFDQLLFNRRTGTLNSAEQELLRIYCRHTVRDSQGQIYYDADGRVVDINSSIDDDAEPYTGALIVLPLAKSKC